jgi:hypothetical protein
MYTSLTTSRAYAFLLVFVPFLVSVSYPSITGMHMDVKCTVYQNGDVDVRILVMGLKVNNDYTARIIPDHNPPVTITTKTDSEGILWVVSKIVNGEISLDFKANVYEGKGVSDPVVVTGDDDAPCRSLPIDNSNAIEQQRFT